MAQSRVAGLLAILAILAESADLEPIASPEFAPVLLGGDQSRVERVMVYIHNHPKERILSAITGVSDEPTGVGQFSVSPVCVRYGNAVRVWSINSNPLVFSLLPPFISRLTPA